MPRPLFLVFEPIGEGRRGLREEAEDAGRATQPFVGWGGGGRKKRKANDSAAHSFTGWGGGRRRSTKKAILILWLVGFEVEGGGEQGQHLYFDQLWAWEEGRAALLTALALLPGCGVEKGKETTHE